MQGRVIWSLVFVILVLTAALSFIIGRQTAPPDRSPQSDAVTVQSEPATTDIQVAETSPAVLRPAPMEKDVGEVATAGAYSEAFDGIEIKFVPTKDFRRMIEYRLGAVEGDSSCSPTYTVSERIDAINYAHDFVIDDFTTWNDEEGKQQYVAMETSLPNAFKGSLKDLVKVGRIATIEKQRCGQGQVEGLVAIR